MKDNPERLKNLNITRNMIWELSEGDEKWEDVSIIVGEILYDESHKLNPRLPWVYAYNYDFLIEMREEWSRVLSPI